jgi:hypothetical protein
MTQQTRQGRASELVQKPDGYLPSWGAVQREQPLGDVAAIL